MKISIYHEDKNVAEVFDVPDEDCEVWINNDYQMRLSCTKDKSSVYRRTPQEITDESNKSTFNNHQKETRRHVSLNALDPQGDTLIGSNGVESHLLDNDYSSLYRAIRTLKPIQQKLIIAVFWKRISQANIARALGVSESAISQRINVILNKLRKSLNREDFSF